ncbi:MAG TPA: hypothetical protein VE267_14465, partial [Bradyrhizobium sp.]|nr:hypothetical protein [Bradyrhizobium sp.]
IRPGEHVDARGIDHRRDPADGCVQRQHRRSASDGLGYLKDATTPVSIQNKIPATRLIEANIAGTNTGHSGKGQTSPLNHLLAHRFNDVGRCRRNGSDMASVEHHGGRQPGLQNGRKGSAVIDADPSERDSGTSRNQAREVPGIPAPPVISHAENDRYCSPGVEPDRPFPVGRKEPTRGDGLDIEIFDPRVLEKPGLAGAAEVAGRSVAFRNGQFSGDGVHDEAVLGLALVTFVIARLLQPQNSGSCLEIGLAAFPADATYLPDARYGSLHKHHQK